MFKTHMLQMVYVPNKSQQHSFNVMIVHIAARQSCCISQPIPAEKWLTAMLKCKVLYLSQANG